MAFITLRQQTLTLQGVVTISKEGDEHADDRLGRNAGSELHHLLADGVLIALFADARCGFAIP
jgi:hypothetical protein